MKNFNDMLSATKMLSEKYSVNLYEPIVIAHGTIDAAIVDVYNCDVHIISQDHLPYTLKGIYDNAKFIERFRDWLSSRVLDLSRSNAKVILNVLALPQLIRTSDRINIVLKCNALTMKDTYWVHAKADKRSYNGVSLRTHKLSDVCYDISILGKHVAATMEELKPELVTGGMYPKFWRRVNDHIMLYKAGKVDSDVQREIDASNIFQQLGIPCVPYMYQHYRDTDFSVCELITSQSLVEQWEIKDWIDNLGENYIDWLKSQYASQIADMCIGDYLTANTDRHIGNFGMIVNSAGDITSFAPLYDFNQCFAADEFNTDIDELIYEPLGVKYADAIKWAIKNTSLRLSDFDYLYNDRVTIRLNILKSL